MSSPIADFLDGVTKTSKRTAAQIKDWADKVAAEANSRVGSGTTVGTQVADTLEAVSDAAQVIGAEDVADDLQGKSESVRKRSSADPITGEDVLAEVGDTVGFGKKKKRGKGKKGKRPSGRRGARRRRSRLGR